MKEVNQLRNLMESINSTYKSVTENTKDEYDDDAYDGGDWGSSDWYGVIKRMDEYIDKNGLNPESIMQGANNLAEFYARPMGHGGDWTAAALDIKDGWVRMSERGQQLQKMFAPKESVHEVSEGMEFNSADDMLKSLLRGLRDDLEMMDSSINEGDIEDVKASYEELQELYTSYMNASVKPSNRQEYPSSM